MRKLTAFLIMFLFCSLGYSQGTTELLEGKVTYLTSRNVYIRFDDTRQIEVGDTLQWKVNGQLTPCLQASQKSSSSVVCIKLMNCDIALEDQVYFFHSKQPETLAEESTTRSEEAPPTPLVTRNSNPTPVGRSQHIRGRISAASYSNLAQNGDDRHRMMYRFSLNANNINDSKFSVESYINYRQNFTSAAESTNSPDRFFRVYNLAMRYDADSTLSLILGRRINNKISSLGAIDGLQAEKQLGQFYVGAIGGFRPDIFEHKLNTNLLQYGGYIGQQVNKKGLYAQTTLGILEQRNTNQIDRRYVYLQHSSTIARNLNLFGSAEFDIYNKVNEVVGNTPRLTNLYVAARYRFSRKISAGVSFDSRKRILFYETLKTDIEQLLEDDLARQGLRFRVNVRPIKNLTVGASYSQRFQSDQQNRSENINGFATYSRIPKIGGRFTLNFNRNTSNYLESMIFSGRYSRALIDRKLNMDTYYRLVNYSYSDSRLKTSSHYIGSGFTYHLNRELMFSILGEYNIKPTDNTYRINCRVIKRFSSK